jgi:two-component system sensor histidine kinase AtoS
MRPDTLIIISLLSLLILLLLFNILKFLSGAQKNRMQWRNKKTDEVGFVVNTFHDLVSKLKDKEKELDLLRMSAEERASEIEIYNENIFQSVPSGVLSFDQDMRITKINTAAEQILSLNKSEILNKKHDEVLDKPITDMLREKRLVERAEIRYVTQYGKSIWLGLTISPLKDSSNNIIGQLLVFTDLTELKAFQSQKELRERLSTLGEMSGGIAHELRNPMAVISGYTKILSRKVDKLLQPTVQSINNEVSVMDRIITDFLSFAKPSELIYTEIVLNELISSCIEAVKGSHNKIAIDFKRNTNCTIRGDEVMIRQAIANLLQNAVQAMPDGGSLDVTVVAGDYLGIMFSDSGHGIPENIRDKIFLPFFTTKERGTGLGLSIVHKIAVSHGGHISVDTGKDGTTITLRLPRDMIISEV